MAAHACNSITLDYNLRHEHEIPANFRLRDTYPTLQNLLSTANQGCSFCRVLVDNVSTVLADQYDRVPFDLEVTGKFLTESDLQSGLEEEDNGVYLLLVNIQYRQQEIPLRFTVHALSESIAATSGRIKRRPLHQDVTSQAAVRLMTGWINDCCNNHHGCRSIGHADPPTRVLDLCHQDSGIDCRLIQFNSISTRHAPYVALSHCWGPSGTKSLSKTTTLTLSSRMQHIPFTSLPRNFQDAVIVTRLLGVRYIWIDSLCIIQDSREDWEREGRRMNQIYKGACVTLAATSASHADEGFLVRPPLNAIELPLAIRTSTNMVHGHVFLRAARSFSNSFEHDVNMSTWDSRGWTLQERYLSQRVLHFCKEKLYFECRSGFQSEDNEWIGFTQLPAILDEEGASIDRSSPHTSDQGKHKESDEDGDEDMILQVDSAFYLFYRLVGQYSPRRLTFPDDKLPALAGIASEVHLQTGSKYLAGLWEDDLAFGLLWTASSPRATTSSLTSTYRGPSWSWVHLDCQVTWQIYWNVPDCPAAGRPARSAMEIVDVQVETSGLNPFGQVASASLVLKAKSLSVSILEVIDRKNKKGRNSFFQHLLERCEVGYKEKRKIGFARLDLEDYRVGAMGSEYRCLQIHEQIPQIGEDKNSWSGLILEQIEEETTITTSSATFKRIGVYLLAEDSLGVFDGIEKGDLKIV